MQIIEILLGLKPIPKSLIEGVSKKATYQSLGAKDELRSNHTSKRVFLTQEAKDRVIKVIDEVVLSGITKPDLVYYKME